MVQMDIFSWLEQCQEVLVTPAFDIPKKAREPWSEKDLEVLHTHLLDESLRDLRRPGLRDAVRRDILHWLNRPIMKNPLPFSFQACCYYDGVNADNMRELILEEFGYGSTRPQ